MVLFLLSVLFGILAGIAAGGRLGALTKLKLRVPALVLCTFAAQAVLARFTTAAFPAGTRVGLLAITYVAAGVWLLLNLPGRSRPLVAALSVAGIGWFLNMCVVLANGDMPVSGSALDRIGQGRALLRGGGPLGKHGQLVASSTLAFLGDVIPLPSLQMVVSVGDLVMVVGIAATIAAAMRDRTSPDPLAGAAATA